MVYSLSQIAQWLMLMALLFLTSCTPHARLESLRTDLARLLDERPAVQGLEGFNDFKGVIHVHSFLSHDSEGTPEEMIQAAQEASLDFMILTDHETPHIFTKGMNGWFQGILVLQGMEITKGCRGSANRCASLLAIDLKEYFDPGPLTFGQVLAEVRRQDGVAIVAHPRGWKDWSLDGIMGLEIYDILDDVMDKKWKFPKYFFDILYSYQSYPAETFLSIQDRPHWHLEKWDQLTQKRKMVAIAGNNSHQNVKVLGRQLDPYALSFRFVSTHLLAPKLNKADLLSALRTGHAYVAFDLLSKAKGFMFRVMHGERMAIMGDEIDFAPGGILTTHSPLPALIVVIKDGSPYRQCHCSTYDLPVEDPGVYRVELYLRIQDHWRPWIFSNPIYIR